MPSEWCAASVIASDESIRVSSSTTIAYASVSAPEPPYSSGNRHAHEPERRQLRNEVVGETLLAVELRRDRRDSIAREFAHGLADELLLLGEVEVQAASCVPSSAISLTP